MRDSMLWLSVAIIALTTAALRFLPFLIWSGARRTPAMIERLGRVLPYAIMGMLVVYCLKDISFTAAGDFVPAFVACAVVVLLHVLRRNTLISIIGGTLCYMALVQLVF